MSVRRQPVKVLRFWYRLSVRPEVQALSHPAFRWLFALVMQWTGHNNGAIEFTRNRHAAPYRLNFPEVFIKARADVLATGLVMVTRAGGRNLPAQYALVNQPLQVAVTAPIFGTPPVPTPSKILGTAPVSMASNPGTAPVPNRYCSSTNKSELHIKIARASEYRKEKCTMQNATSTDLRFAKQTVAEACHAEEQQEFAERVGNRERDEQSSVDGSLQGRIAASGRGTR